MEGKFQSSLATQDNEFCQNSSQGSASLILHRLLKLGAFVRSEGTSPIAAT